jgi:YegS/Rv2252/BmrU family lipid kinase
MRAISRHAVSGDRRAGAGARPDRTDQFFVALTRAADHSLLWIALSVPLAAGGRRARSAAARGLSAAAVTSAVTNIVLKRAFRRERPAQHLPLIRQPGSFAFPSGHSASAFAFATAASWQLPGLAPLLMPLAAGVAYSRVRAGVHHRGDVLAGSVIGAAFGLIVTAGAGRLRGRHRTGAAAPLLTEAVLVTSPRIADSRDLAAARQELRRIGVTITAHIGVGDTGKLLDLLAARGEDPALVIAAGGDGTTGAVADVLAGTPHVLGAVPLGTSNNFARSLGIPVDPRQAAALFADGKIATIDLGRCQPDGKPPRHFVHAATIGLNVNFARIATAAAIRDRLGRSAYLLAAAYAMRKRPAFTCEMSFAGTTEKATLTQLSIINAPVFGGPLRLSVPASDPDDRLLDILAVEDVPARRMLLAALAMLLRARQQIPGIRIWHTARLHVQAGEPLEVTLDGEILGTLPASFEVAGEALRVITPLGFVDIDD